MQTFVSLQIWILAGLICLLLACSQSDNTSTDQQDVEVSTSTAPAPATAPTPSIKPPYIIEDSSLVKEIEGVKIYTIVQGSGPYPKAGSNVLIHYRGTLEDGSEFDSSFSRGTLADYSLKQLIKGWQIALTNVQVGSKVKLVIPPELGYGSQAKSNIPPNSTLIFDIDLVSTY